jgi:hypothetical protein
MNPSTLLLLVGVLACPIVMGVMMWQMNKNMTDRPTSSQSQDERLATLRAQRQALEAEMAEVTKIAELEAKRGALSSKAKSGDEAGRVSEAQSPMR